MRSQRVILRDLKKPEKWADRSSTKFNEEKHVKSWSMQTGASPGTQTCWSHPAGKQLCRKDYGEPVWKQANIVPLSIKKLWVFLTVLLRITAAGWRMWSFSSFQHMRPQLEYYIQLWAPQSETCDILEGVQPRATRKTKRQEHPSYEEKLRELDLLSLGEAILSFS